MPRYFAPITKEELTTKIFEGFAAFEDGECLKGWKEDLPRLLTNLGKTPTVELTVYSLINSEGFGIPWRYLTPKVEADLSKCDFDVENVNCKKGYDGAEEIAGFHTLPNGLTYLGVSAGGDWEVPVFFIMYFDGKDLRAYIPKDGNPWNTNSHQAYGNDDDEGDNSNAKKRFGVDDCQDAHLDPAAVIRDIEGRLVSGERK